MKLFRILAALVLFIAVALGTRWWLHAPPAPPSANAPVWTPVTKEHLSHGRFAHVTAYVPHGSPRGVVLLLSGPGGWNAAMHDLASGLAEHGALVAGLDMTQLTAVLEADPAQCVYPDGDLENLSHFVQAYYHLPTYVNPILAGTGSGGTLAYATLVQAPQGTFAGAVSLDFCPTLPLDKPLCKGSGIEFSAAPGGKGVVFAPSKLTGNAWTVLQRPEVQGCDVTTVRDFVAQVPGARLDSVPNAVAGAAPSTTTTATTAAAIGAPQPLAPAIAAAFDRSMAQQPGIAAAVVPAALADLPIVTVAAQAPAVATGRGPADTLAILLSGDGGWAGLDKEVADSLAASGIPVIGVDSLRYFWSARTPAGLAADLDRIARYYLGALGKQRVLLIGYSQGADVLPFAVNRLSDATRSRVALTAIMGMSEHALFEFHMSSWISDDASGPATLPEVDRITGIPVLCIYGEGETDTLCPKLDPHKVTIVELKGGHHFGGDYGALARAILAAAHP